ncbi:MAG: hypothetical protein J5518_06935 [Lachnospiraceae bacterium]|nr:hypothetical protein [Lachnospiraceae bacterium]
MIRYLEPLFTTEKTDGKVEKVKRSFQNGAGLINLYLITIASNEADVFDIIPVPLLKQRAFRHRDYDVIGLAEDQTAAFGLVQRIHEEYYKAFHSYTGIRAWLLEKLAEQEQKA